MSGLGLAIDIDDTLSETALTCCRLIGEKFGLPDNISVEKILQKYNQPTNVPNWRVNKEVVNWLKNELNNPEFIGSLPAVAGARESLAIISERVPVKAYISSRLTHLNECSVNWLKENGFPPAPVILREDSIRDPNWKIKHLLAQKMSVYGIIDDTLEAFSDLKSDFKGKLFWLDRFNLLSQDIHHQVIRVKNWNEIKDQILSDTNL